MPRCSAAYRQRISLSRRSGLDRRGARGFGLRTDFDARDRRYDRVDRSPAARFDEIDSLPDQRARAEIIDEDALYEALARRSIAGAALDVWYRYPHEPGRSAPATRPFHELPNVLMTPHVAGWTDGMLDTRAKLIAENIRRVACGETPLNLIA